MPDLLFELFSEEIPARMQGQAADDLKRLVTDALVARGLTYEGAAAHVTPRRLALHVAGLPVRQPDTREEKKGPRVGAPEAAVNGFLKGAGLASLAEARIEKDPKKGEFYVAVIERPGQATVDVLVDILPAIIRTFPWPKSMRWGAASARPDALRWVRPLQSILCTFGPETEEPVVVPFSIDGLVAGNVTYGHRFMAPAAIPVRRFDDYVSSLEKAKVVLDRERRKNIILHDARDLAFAQGFELVEDVGLLDEVAGLVEWPVVLIGTFDAAFLDIPPEVIRATIRANQKCFVLRDATTKKLANAFVVVANIEASDGGKVIAAGNGRVVQARLSDAQFFWKTDLKMDQEDRVPKLDGIIFHEKLGTQGARVNRIMTLAKELAPLVHADEDKANIAAMLAKTDLVSEMVGEFPELQGLMGRYYATHADLHASVAAAIEEHYKPQGPTDRVPSDPVSVAVALADKFDTLVGFWAINEKPTGSKDPYALRRAALGIIRIILENKLRFNIRDIFIKTVQHYLNEKSSLIEKQVFEWSGFTAANISNPSHLRPVDVGRAYRSSGFGEFLKERLKISLREQGIRHDIIDAVLALPGLDDLLMIVSRVDALQKFLDTEDGRNLLAGYRRAANILRAEEKKERPRAFDIPYERAQLILPLELSLANALDSAIEGAAASIKVEDFEAAMRALSHLRAPVDAFFEKVTVNDPDPALRINRLRLLNGFRQAVHTVADFSKIGDSGPARAKDAM